MKMTASGGTDGANIVLFWPDNLPEDADRALRDDPIPLIERLRDEGKLIWFPCDGDGGYTVGIFVGCEVPDYLRALCRAEETYPLLLARGAGYFGGMEYIFKHDDRLLRGAPHMCEKILIPEGAYSGGVWRTDVPKSAYKSWLEREVGPGAKRFWDIYRFCIAYSVTGLIVLTITFCFATWVFWFCILALESTLVVVAVAMSRTNRYRAVARARREYKDVSLLCRSLAATQRAGKCRICLISAETGFRLPSHQASRALS
jgi:hypothetical protein